MPKFVFLFTLGKRLAEFLYLYQCAQRLLRDIILDVDALIQGRRDEQNL